MQQVLFNTRKEALLVKKVPIDLQGCENCNFVFNSRFKPSETTYSALYDSSQQFSPIFSNYLNALAKRLVKNHNLMNKYVVEVGCGKGHFLKLLFLLGLKNLQGFDPSYSNHDEKIDSLVVKKFFNKKNAGFKADFIICRHVLEHIKEPKRFLEEITKSLSERGGFYFDFPRLEWIVENEAFFDFYFEHCNYFSEKAVLMLFKSIGYNSIDVGYGLDGQYFEVESSKVKSKYKTSRCEHVDFAVITNFIQRKIAYYKKQLKNAKRFIIWGAGAKGLTFLKYLNVSFRKSPFIVDINSAKQNKYLPLTGQKVVPSLILKERRFDTIIIMNPIYTKEIKKEARNLGFKGKFITV